MMPATPKQIAALESILAVCNFLLKSAALPFLASPLATQAQIAPGRPSGRKQATAKSDPTKIQVRESDSSA